ncbi:putative zinc finger protein, partial [Orchesella cincta]
MFPNVKPCFVKLEKLKTSDYLFRNIQTKPKSTSKKHSFICSICHKQLASKHSLETHIHSHTGERPYPCTTCKQSFRKLDICNLMKDSSPTPVKSATFTDKYTLQEHYRCSHGSGKRRTASKKFKCNLCKIWCSSASKLATHMRKHTGERPFPIISALAYCSFNLRRETISLFNVLSILHEKTHVEKHILRKHTNLVERYQSPVCAKILGTERGLSYHIKIHTGERPFKCKPVKNRSEVSAHQLVHTKERHFPNFQCNSAFARVSELQNHVRYVHGTEKRPVSNKKVECPDCNTIARKTTLWAHQKTQGNERKYICSVCNKAYKKADHLKVHNRTHTS